MMNLWDDRHMDKMREITATIIQYEEDFTQRTKGLEYAFDSIKDMVVIVDPTSKITYANKAMIDEFGSGNIVGERCDGILFGGKSVCDMYRENSLGDSPVYSFKSNKWYETNVSEIKCSASDEPLGYVCIIRDITKRMSTNRRQTKDTVISAPSYIC